MQAQASIKAIAGLGLEGDRYAKKLGFWQNIPKPRPKIRDVSLIRLADIENTNFSAAETRRNLVIDTKFSLLDLIGKKFRLGDAEFLGIEDCTPCQRPSDLSGKSGFAQAFKNTGGLRAQVLQTGMIKIGDVLSLV